MALNDLTTLARVKQYLGMDPTDTSNDAKLAIFITTLSAACLGDMSRDTLFLKAYTDVLDGTGTDKIMLAKWPVLSLSGVAINGVPVPVSPNPPLGAGYAFEDWQGVPPGEPCRVMLYGFRFTRGTGNVTIQYQAGYGIQGEPQTVPDNPGPYTITPDMPYGIISADNGVTYAATGLPLKAVKANPTVGQYIPPSPFATVNPTNAYTFNQNDAMENVLLSYSFVPDAVEGAVRQWVAEQWAYKDRVGIQSKALGGQETVSFIVNQIPAFVQLAIQPYRNIVPLQ